MASADGEQGRGGGGPRHDSVVLCFVISIVRSDIFVG